MKKIIMAAFLWDTSRRSISFMIINSYYQIVYAPQKHNLGTLSYANFTRLAATLIDTFFDKVVAACREEKCPARIEYKIVHPVPQTLDHYYQPSSRSLFVRKQFLAAYKKADGHPEEIILSQQLRARLRRPELDRFKNTLRNHAIVQRKRDNTFQFHLWVLATHATKSNYARILKRILKYLSPKAA